MTPRTPTNPDCASDDVDTQTALEQYKLYAELADRSSVRRGSANVFLVSIHAGILAAYGFSVKEPIGQVMRSIAIIGLPLVGLTLCWVWAVTLRSYHRLSREKWRVVQAMETELPMAPWTDEWKDLGGATGRRKHVRQTTAELLAVVMIGLAYVALLVGAHWVLVETGAEAARSERASSSAASYVARNTESLHGYRSPSTPVMSQSPGAAIIVPSSVAITLGANRRSAVISTGFFLNLGIAIASAADYTTLAGHQAEYGGRGASATNGRKLVTVYTIGQRGNVY